MTHLHSDELRRWHQEGAAAERERVLGHLAGCDACRRAYAALVREGAASPAADLTREAVPLGQRAFKPERPARGRAFGWPAWALSGAAALLVLAASALVLRPGPSPAPAPAPSAAVRGDEIQPLAPAGETAGPLVFRWSSPVRAARFHLAVRDRTGAVVYRAEAAEERHEPVPGALRAGGAWTWQVEALDANGAVVARSPEQPFRLAER